MAEHGPIQQFTEVCLSCGFNVWDPKCPSSCPGPKRSGHPFWDRINAAEVARNKKEDDYWGNQVW